MTFMASRPHDRRTPRVALGIYDPLSAAIASTVDVDFLWLSSYSVCTSQGLPDTGALTLALQEQLLSRILAKTRIPVIVDVDNGSNSERHCHLIADRLSQIGVAGLCIEDKAGSKESSLYRTPQTLRAPSEFARILSLFRQRTSNLLLLARLEGLNYDERPAVILEKARLCREAGADYLILHNTSPSIQQLKKIMGECAALCPLGLIPTTYLSRLSELNPASVSLLIYANQMLRARIMTEKRVAALVAEQSTLPTDMLAEIEETNILGSG